MEHQENRRDREVCDDGNIRRITLVKLRRKKPAVLSWLLIALFLSRKWIRTCVCSYFSIMANIVTVGQGMLVRSDGYSKNSCITETAL